jgi:hypothetical protein
VGKKIDLTLGFSLSYGDGRSRDEARNHDENGDKFADAGFHSLVAGVRSGLGRRFVAGEIREAAGCGSCNGSGWECVSAAGRYLHRMVGWMSNMPAPFDWKNVVFQYWNSVPGGGGVLPAALRA